MSAPPHALDFQVEFECDAMHPFVSVTFGDPSCHSTDDGDLLLNTTLGEQSH